MTTETGEEAGSSSADDGLCRDVRFPDTRWSLIAGAGAPEESARHDAVAELCRLYWYPVYAFARSRGCRPHQAEDMTQNLFLKFLRNDSFRGADRTRGRLRTYLLTSMSRLLSNEARRGDAAKRAPEKFAIPIERDEAEARLELEAAWTSVATPDCQFDRRWAEVLLHEVENRLKREHEALGKAEQFEKLRQFVSGDGSGSSYASVAEALGMTEGAVKVAVHRLRKRFKMILRDEIAHTVNNQSEVDAELEHLFAVLAGC